jgi:hypothetical protein
MLSKYCNTTWDPIARDSEVFIIEVNYGQNMWRVWGRKEVCTGCWWGNLRDRDRWGDPDVDGRIILRWIFRKFEGVVGTGWS